MHGLAVFEHHVVADIDDVVDRAQADGREAGLNPIGGRTDFDSGDNGRGVERAIGGRINANGLEQVGPRVGGDRGGREADGRIREVFFEPRGEFAGDAEVRQRVGAVGRDLDVEHRVAGGQNVVDRRADRGFAGEKEQTLRVFGEGEFLGGAHHAGRGLSADLGFFDDEIAGEHGAGERDGHAVADVAVGRAADDGAHAAMGGTDIDGANGELVGVGVFVAREDVADDDVVERGGAGADDLLDLEAEEGDRARNVIGRNTGEIDVGLEPGEGNFHRKSRFRSCPRNTRKDTKVGNDGVPTWFLFRVVSCVSWAKKV